MEDFENYKDLILKFIIENGINLIIAIVVLIIGFWITKLITKGIKRVFDKKGFDPNLKSFVVGIASFLLKALVVISVLGMVGVEMTSFVAILGAAGLAVGLALSGTLQNFAGGAIILIIKPFKVGDLIEAQGYTGRVKEIQVFNTILTTLDNKTIILPNGPLSTDSLVNYSTQETRRVDMVIGVSYDDDVDKVKETIIDIIKNDSRILDEPKPLVAIKEFADSSVNFVVRPWVKTDDYWDVFFETNEKIKKSFDANGITIPFPQRDIHVYNEEK